MDNKVRLQTGLLAAGFTAFLAVWLAVVFLALLPPAAVAGIYLGAKGVAPEVWPYLSVALAAAWIVAADAWEK